MKRISQFEKVSYNQFRNDVLDTFPRYKEYKEHNEEKFNKFLIGTYNNIILPSRSTEFSAGYDFHSPFNVTLMPNESIKIPTGIKCYMEDGWALQCYPRSSHGFKHGIRLANTVAIIDKDYYNNKDNEGHIFIKFTNESLLANPVSFNIGDAFCQGIFVQFGITYDDNTKNTRIGGIGSTDK